MQRLEDHEQKLSAHAQINHAKAVKDSVKANMPKFLPHAVSKFVQPQLERIVLDVIKKNLFNELVDVDKEPEEHTLQLGSTVMFGKYMKKLLNKYKITKADLKGPTFKFIKNMFKNNMELDYNLEQCYLALTDRINWTNPEEERFYNDLSKLLPLTGPPSRKTIPTRYFFNNDLKYLRHGNEEKKYDISKDDRYLFYKGSIGHKSPHDVYLKLKIISVQRIKVVKKYGYRYLEEIVVKRVDHKECTFAEADFPRLNQNDIEDMYLLKIQDKIHYIDGIDEFDMINALQIYIQQIVIRKRVKDAWIGVESYQKKLNLTKP
nr:hypothetical protein [Tanacetum cinerariifolium]